MTGFLIRRLMQSIVVLAVLSFLIFCLMALMPGDPIDVLMAWLERAVFSSPTPAPVSPPGFGGCVVVVPSPTRVPRRLP